MSSMKVSPLMGQELWAAVSVVFCIAVIFIFFFILCCAYRRHRRVRDVSIFTEPREQLGNSIAPFVISNMRDKSEEHKHTSYVWIEQCDIADLSLKATFKI